MTITSRQSFTDENIEYKSIKIKASDNGMMHMQAAVGLLHLLEFARPFQVVARRPLDAVLGVVDLLIASAMAEARSRSRTLNLIGMKRRLFSR